VYQLNVLYWMLDKVYFLWYINIVKIHSISTIICVAVCQTVLLESVYLISYNRTKWHNAACMV
jgi:hypothetical protein